MAGVDALVPIGSITLTANQPSISFGSIPGTFRDLRIVANYGVTADADVGMQVNGDTGSNYVVANMRANGSTTAFASATPTSVNFGLQNVTVPTTLTTSSIVEWLDYSATDKQKPCVVRASDATALVIMKVGRWTGTSAITSITMYGISANLLAGSTFNLFGIRG